MNTIKIESGTVKMVAHRGLSGIERENTCAAFVAAGNRSYYGIETDIHTTVDGHIVVFHDDTTKRIGIDDLTIEETTFDTIRNLLLTERESGLRGRSDIRIPTLEEYIGICKTYEKYCVLEIKNRFSDADIDRTVDIIRSMGWLDHVIFISFSIENLIHLREILPEQPAQYLTCDVSSDTMNKLEKYNLDLDVQHGALTREAVERLHANGRKVNCWTCDDKLRAEELVSWGVDFITSNIVE